MQPFVRHLEATIGRLLTEEEREATVAFEDVDAEMLREAMALYERSRLDAIAYCRYRLAFEHALVVPAFVEFICKDQRSLGEWLALRDANRS